MSIRHYLKELYYIRIKKLSLSDVRIMHLRKVGVTIGDNCFIFSDWLETPEPYLIKIGSGVTISTGVRFATHDDSSEYYLGRGELVVGKITIGNNVFVGMGSLILPGVTIADNCIIGAGSVVTRSVDEEGVVLAGNPARPIGTVAELREKNAGKAINTSGLGFDEKRRLHLSKQHLFK